MKRLGLALSACTLIGCSTDSPSTERPHLNCFRPSEVARWGSFERTQFWVETARGDVYAGRLRSVCPSVDWAKQLSIQPQAGWEVCPGDQARLVVPDPTSRTEICEVDSFHPVSGEDAAALTRKKT